MLCELIFCPETKLCLLFDISVIFQTLQKCGRVENLRIALDYLFTNKFIAILSFLYAKCRSELGLVYYNISY